MRFWIFCNFKICLASLNLYLNNGSKLTGEHPVWSFNSTGDGSWQYAQIPLNVSSGKVKVSNDTLH